MLVTCFMNQAIWPKGFAAAGSASSTATFGCTTVGASTCYFPSEYTVSCSFQAPQTGTITSISMYMEPTQTNSHVLLGVYSSLNGEPYQLIAKSSWVTMENGYSWVTASLTASVSAGQTYWLTMLPSSIVNWKYNSGGSSEIGFGIDATTLSTAYGYFIAWQAGEMSIYATYTATASASPTPTPTPSPTPSPSPSPTSSPTPTPSPSPTASGTSSVNIGVFSNSACTSAESSISWGQLKPGGTSSVTVYVLNEGSQPVTLSLSLTNLSPSTLSSDITLTWNYAGQTLAASSSLEVTLSLALSASVSNTNNFTFNVVISGTST